MSAVRTLGAVSIASAFALVPLAAFSDETPAPAPAASSSASDSSSSSAPAVASSAPPKASASSSGALPGGPGAGEAFLGRSVTTWDLNLELGYGAVLLKDEKPGFFFGRARVGVLNISDYVYLSMFGATVDYNSRGPVAFGLQGELLHLEMGLWLQLGGLVDIKGRFGGTGSVGWSLFGIEVENRAFEDEIGRGWSFFGKIRIPVSIIYRAARPRH